MFTLQRLLCASLPLFLPAQAVIVNRADLIPLEGRSTYYGGFSLAVSPVQKCPSSTISCNVTAIGGSNTTGPCCPAGTVCVGDGGGYCCPSSTDCSNTVRQSPTCADPSWTMFTSNAGVSYCCPAGQIFDEAISCADPGGSEGDAPNTAFTSAVQSNNAPPAGGAATAPASGASGNVTPVATSAQTTPTTAQTSPSSTAKSGSERAAKSNGYLSLLMLFSLLLM